MPQRGVRACKSCHSENGEGAAGFPRLALWGTALFFAVSHANLMAFLPLTFFGLVLALLYEATDNLLAPITVHALFNAINLVLLLVETGNR